MPKAETAAYPDTATLRMFMKEYAQMLREAERAAKKILSLNPQTERFWDALSESAALFTMIRARSGTIEEEIDSLIDQLPDD
jgi:hypothetical protein